MVKRVTNSERLQAYEAAIGLNGNHLSTRHSLAKLCRELGMTDMAEIHEAVILQQEKTEK